MSSIRDLCAEGVERRKSCSRCSRDWGVEVTFRNGTKLLFCFLCYLGAPLPTAEVAR